MITLDEYKQLSFEEKAQVTSAGEYLIGRYLTENHAIALYSVFDFYVEVQYDKRRERIIDFIAFKCTNYAMLETFLRQIRLKDLV
ncbi:hypothetical protein QNI19_31850 [Cytophagaceae bacterium DM2B3-1]|uniref:Uncharacterized protein n=1 Tax=Xanthocytophaga flava TaxID=3048013 RepID=A0ABT7CV87_9BACT|nr:hypothetical protein [Xanthocytophaga flavus]MDJ1497576.1 hypothetical protein [Xanthocytophaga flavus]